MPLARVSGQPFDALVDHADGRRRVGGPGEALMTLRLAALIVTLAFGIFWAPLAAEPQPAGKVYRVAVFGLLPREAGVPFLKALESGLRDLGYVEGRRRKARTAS